MNVWISVVQFSRGRGGWRRSTTELFGWRKHGDGSLVQVYGRWSDAAVRPDCWARCGVLSLWTGEGTPSVTLLQFRGPLERRAGNSLNTFTRSLRCVILIRKKDQMLAVAALFRRGIRWVEIFRNFLLMVAPAEEASVCARSYCRNF